MHKDVDVMLAIETSCDDTSVAILKGRTELLSNLVSSQTKFHARYGGIVPEIAARKHLELLNPLIEEAINEAKIEFSDIDAVATTVGPGLVISLLIGSCGAKAIAYSLSVPFIGVNHLEGHIYSAFLDEPELKPPLLCLIVSGGHTQLAIMKDHGEYELLGQTLDDAVGEAMDKAGMFLGLGYPGGPVIDELAKKGDPAYYDLPRALITRNDYNFSLSGVKTALINLTKKERLLGREISLQDICASFQAAIFDVLEAKTIRAMKEFNMDKLILAGGVASNSQLRKRFSVASHKYNFEFIVPEHKYCTDNAAMIAVAAHYKLQKGLISPLEIPVSSTMHL